MSFKITIEETKDVRKIKGKEWVKVGQIEKRGDFSEKVYMSDEMGYSPEVETIATQTVKIYEQVVDTLDLKDVIQAINL